jgi:hypothetical protein
VEAGGTISGDTKLGGRALSLLLVVTCVAAIFAASGRAGAAPTHERNCSFVSIPQIIEGGSMELIASGDRHLPTCRRVKRIVHLVPKRLPPRTWGLVTGWKCNWSRLGGVECGRHGARIVAYPGGD